MTTTKKLICFKCKHWKIHEMGCNAFEEIPDEVLINNEHNKPLPDQDNDLVFEEGDPADL